MNKQLLLGALMLCSAASVSAQNNILQVKGNVKNAETSLWVIYGDHRDTIPVKNGKFAFTAQINEPTRMYIIPVAEEGRAIRMGGNQMLAMPGEKMTITGDLNADYSFGGSNFYKDYNKVNLMLKDADKELNAFGDSLSECMRKGQSEETLMPIYEARIGGIQQRKADKVLAFIAANPSMEAAATTILALNDADQMDKAVALLSPEVKEGRMKSYYAPYIERVKAAKEREERAKKVQASGAPATDFTLNDINGNPFTLSSLKGKYVVLDFWGSWCGWCIKGMPQMKEYYKKYAGKFEIVGIDCNDTEEKWKEAVKKHELPWIHVYNSKGDKDICQPYAIQGFPTKIVVGPDGNIVKTVVGEDPAFYSFLDELLGK